MTTPLFVRVDPTTLKVVWKYTGMKLEEGDIPCEIPFDVLADQAVRGEDGSITLTTDPAKVAAKTQAQWTAVRAQQRQKLYESDWTCSVTDYEVPNKDQWVAYRQALRDVTKQSDPFNIEWPTSP
jgi:Phage tail assembly chaperone protein